MAATQQDIFGRATRHTYPADFERTWLEYPKRNGANPKTAAFRAYVARVRAGSCPEQIHEGVKAYAKWVENEGWVGTPYVMQASRFLGPDEYYLEDWTVQKTYKVEKSLEGVRQFIREHPDVVPRKIRCQHWRVAYAYIRDLTP